MKEKISLKRKLAFTERTLRKLYGTPVWDALDPIDELILTILSQNTNDHNRDVAFAQLKSFYRNWQQVLDSEVEDIEKAIKPAGLGKIKSKRIKDILFWIKNTFGDFNLDSLITKSDDEAISILTSQNGIGIKTAAVVMAFSFNRDLCPVDTHIHRIARRLGWVNHNISPEKTFHIIRKEIPKGRGLSFHLNLLKFGRNICTAKGPKCDICPIKNSCSYILSAR